MNLNLENPMIERNTKTVYRDGDKTIKLFVENYSKSDILNEALNQARVEEYTDLCVPKLLEVSNVNNRWGIVLEHIEGTPLNKLMEENPEKEDEYLNWFVDIQLYVLSKTAPMLNRMHDKYKRKINSLNNISDNIRYELLQRLDSMKDHTKLCHGDFNPSNVIIKPDGQAAILDWAHVTIGNAASDAANTYMLFIMDGKEEIAKKYLDLFVEKSGIEKNLVQRWLPIVAASRKAKGIAEEQEFLNKWIDVVDFS